MDAVQLVWNYNNIVDQYRSYSICDCVLDIQNFYGWKKGEVSMGVRKEYMDVAWKVARKLINLSDKDRENIFGYSDVSRIIKNFSVLKVEFKIAKYEKELREEEIEVGDIVKCNFLYKGIVSFIDYDENGEEFFEVIVGNGELKTFSRDELTKTGRNVDILNTISRLAYDEGYADESGLSSAT